MMPGSLEIQFLHVDDGGLVRSINPEAHRTPGAQQNNAVERYYRPEAA